MEGLPDVDQELCCSHSNIALPSRFQRGGSVEEGSPIENRSKNEGTDQNQDGSPGEPLSTCRVWPTDRFDGGWECHWCSRLHIRIRCR